MSKQPSFAWARLIGGSVAPPAGSQSITELVELLSRDLASGAMVALGFEAPLFIPVPPTERPECLSQRRENEGQRSWSAPAGGYVATLAIHQAAWLLQAIAPSRPSTCAFTLDASSWAIGHETGLLLCWEAFVSEAAHASKSDPQRHLRDAATAAVWFRTCETDLTAHHAVRAKHCLSLIGAAALWSGWCTDVGALHNEALVLRPSTRYEGAIVGI